MYSQRPNLILGFHGCDEVKKITIGLGTEFISGRIIMTELWIGQKIKSDVGRSISPR